MTEPKTHSEETDKDGPLKAMSRLAIVDIFEEEVTWMEISSTGPEELAGNVWNIRLFKDVTWYLVMGRTFGGSQLGMHPRVDRDDRGTLWMRVGTHGQSQGIDMQ